jgi:four helix bundle protein
VDYKDLKAWQQSMNLVERIYELAKTLPKEETYALSDQLRRAVVSVPSNIAEGQNRNTNKEFIQFLYIALGSISEVETQLMICERLNYLSNIENELDAITQIRKMLNGLIKSIKSQQ